ncbi:hypothetical protein [Bradyrhizobium sp. URHC0002]
MQQNEINAQLALSQPDGFDESGEAIAETDGVTGYELWSSLANFQKV